MSVAKGFVLLSVIRGAGDRIVSMCPTDQAWHSIRGTYALVLKLESPLELQVGRLGRIRFEAPYYLYFGSAFGPGGLGARINHHLQPARHPHWHIDHLRQMTTVVGVWYTNDVAHLECDWANAASAHRGVLPVPGFGSSDCGCYTHLIATPRFPSRSAFRRQLNAVHPGCARIRQLQLARPHAA